MSDYWKPTKISTFLEPVRRPERLDPTREYRLIGVRLDGSGPFHRETKPGSQIAATTLFEVRDGDFIYSRLFAWRGAFGIIRSDLDDHYVSGEFPTFKSVSKEINLEFLQLWFRLPSTLSKVEAVCTGSTPLSRNRFKERFFLNMEIPLPPIDEQNQIVAQFKELASKIGDIRKLQEEILTAIQRLLSEAYAQTARDAELLPMSEVAPLVRRQVEVKLSGNYMELGIRSFGKGTFHKEPIDGASLGTKRIFRIETGDLLFHNVFAWEGAVAVAKSEDNGRVGSHRFLTYVPKRGQPMSSFLCFHFQTDAGLKEIGDASPGGAGRNRTLGVKAMEQIRVPTPSPEKLAWFDSILQRADTIKLLQTETSTKLNELLPSFLYRVLR